MTGGLRFLRLKTSPTLATTTTTTTTPTIAQVQGKPDEDAFDVMAEYCCLATDTGSGPAWRLKLGTLDDPSPRSEVLADSSTPTNPELDWK